MSRYLIYRPNSRDFLCVVAARDKRHALSVARQMFVIPRGTTAVLERSAA